MPLSPAEPGPPARRPSWKWWVCGLLLLATMLNYMDRIALNQTSPLILEEFGMGPEDYGNVQSAFGVAFALGALVMGFLADFWNVYWIYPVLLVAWSGAGFVTGFVTGLTGLLWCRFLLGLAEAGNWPCALRTTQRILPPEHRTLGNSILQSGAAVGSILTPLIVLGFLAGTGSWRPPFLVIGVAGCSWAGLWLLLLRPRDLALHRPPQFPQEAPGLDRRGYWGALAAIWSDRRFWVLLVVTTSINLTWHFFLAWLPLFLQRGHGYTTEETQWITSGYFIATDLGSLSAGFATIALLRRGRSVHRSRLTVFLACALLTCLSIVAALLPTGPLLLAVLLVIGFAALGLFPCYYSLSQELTVRHQGKVTGMLGFGCWLAVALLHHVAGAFIEATGSYTLGVALAGLPPLLAWTVLTFFWKEARKPEAQALAAPSRELSVPIPPPAGALAMEEKG